jgi:hypothetical protein
MGVFGGNHTCVRMPEAERLQAVRCLSYLDDHVVTPFYRLQERLQHTIFLTSTVSYNNKKLYIATLKSE